MSIYLRNAVFLFTLGRAALRRRLMEKLQLAAPLAESREAADWCARLSREADWMLPPGRYC